MKKILVTLLVCAGMAGMTVSAQEFKPQAGSFMLETGFSPFSTSGENIHLQGGEIRAIYLPSDNLGIRLGVGFGSYTDKNDNGETGNSWEETIAKENMFSVSPGVFYMFEGTDRLAPYVGAEFIFASVSNNTTVERENYKLETENTGSDVFNTLGFGIFTGFNYYFSKNIYVGAEIGIDIANTSYKNAVVTTNQNGTISTTESKSDLSSLGLATTFNPSIRLGWAF